MSWLFAFMLAAFVALTLLSWPILFSFDLWIVNDRGSLLNLDYLWSDGLRLGVDAYYSYGLLPIALQHLGFAFGRGYWPMIGWTVAALVAMALIWAVLFRRLPRGPAWLLAILCVTPMLLWVNPNFPYTLALVSMLGALALVARDRADLALAVVAIGCWSVPSLPLVLVALLGLLTLVQWWAGARTPAALVRALAPGAVAYLAIGGVLVAVFGWPSVLATALPFQGAGFYAAKGYGFAKVLEFISPPGAGLTYYLFSRSAWWMVSSAMLACLAVVALARMLRARAADPTGCVVLMLAVLHATFVFLAGGSVSQHIVFDPLLGGGVLVGLATLSRGAVRGGLLAVFAGLALFGDVAQARETRWAWRNEAASPAMAGLYASPDFTRAWQRVVAAAADRRLLLLTYGTGAHHYFPTVQSPATWFLEVGQTRPADEDRVFAQMRAAEVIVTATDSPYFADNERFRSYLASLCLTGSDGYFRFWQRRETLAPGAVCVRSPVSR